MLSTDFIFYAVADPSKALLNKFKITNLPALACYTEVHDGEEKTVKEFAYTGPMNFNDMLIHIAIESKWDKEVNHQLKHDKRRIQIEKRRRIYEQKKRERLEKMRFDEL